MPRAQANFCRFFVGLRLLGIDDHWHPPYSSDYFDRTSRFSPQLDETRNTYDLSASSGSRWRELTRAYSVFWRLSMVFRLSFSSGRMLASISAFFESISWK